MAIPIPTLFPHPLLQEAAEPGRLQSLFDMLLDGGPVMVPLALCSVVSLAYVVERFLRLTGAVLGTRSFGRQVLRTVDEDGIAAGLELCRRRDTPLARILATHLRHWGAPFLELEKAVEDAGERELQRISANLRPLVVVGNIAPLLGLLGTVWGMIQAFGTIATGDGLGRPEMLAEGISQALITTAAGLAIAIPTQAFYFHFRSRIDRFARLAEELHVELVERRLGRQEAS